MDGIANGTSDDAALDWFRREVTDTAAPSNPSRTMMKNEAIRLGSEAVISVVEPMTVSVVACAAVVVTRRGVVNGEMDDDESKVVTGAGTVPTCVVPGLTVVADRGAAVVGVVALVVAAEVDAMVVRGVPVARVDGVVVAAVVGAVVASVVGGAVVSGAVVSGAVVDGASVVVGAVVVDGMVVGMVVTGAVVVGSSAVAGAGAADTTNATATTHTTRARVDNQPPITCAV